MTLTVISHVVQPRRAFHSTLTTTVALDDLEDCDLFALYSLPQSIIIDRYELADRRLSFEFWGESNLELPVFALDRTASSLLLVNATPTAVHATKVTLDIPVHARYAEPDTGHTISISSPVCFWACPPSARLSAAFFRESPVANSTMLGSLAYFSTPSMSSHSAQLQIPVPSMHDLFPVEMGTATVILMAFLWLAYRSWKVANTLQSCHLKDQ